MERPAGVTVRPVVYPVWHERMGPSMALGMLTAAARHFDDGDLERRYEILRPLEAGAALERLESEGRGPAVLLCSDYLWSTADNLRFAREARVINPDIVIVHGGPDSPDQRAEAEDFLKAHRPAVDIIVHGAGEDAVCEILAAGVEDRSKVRQRWYAIAGISFLDGGAYQRTPDRPRRLDLAALPSPMLTGEFDDIEARSWRTGMTIESNRGCPYGCTFCDWGSLTLARVGYFPPERTAAEIRWVAERGIKAIQFADANFGMTKRDIEVMQEVVDVHAETGFPRMVQFAPAKNTLKHVLRIFEMLRDSGIGTAASIGLQSTDPVVLDAIRRTNIPTERLLELSREMRAHGFPVPVEFVVGLPLQTVDSFLDDLQFAFDHELMARVHMLRVLPNAPMNEPDYREQYGLTTDASGHVRATATMTPEDYDLVSLYVRIDLMVNHTGVLRHVARWLQWDCDIPLPVFYRHLADRIRGGASELDQFTRLLELLPDRFTFAIDWGAFYSEIRSFITTTLGVPPSSALESVLAAQQHLVARPDRTFPDQIDLDHDLVAYARGAGWGITGPLPDEGADPMARPRPAKRLSDYGPGALVVDGDPARIGEGAKSEWHSGHLVRTESSDAVVMECFELLSPLTSPTAFFLMQQARGDLRDHLLRYQSEVRNDVGTPVRMSMTSVVPGHQGST